MYIRNDNELYWHSLTDDEERFDNHFYLFIYAIVQILYIAFCCGFFGFFLFY